MPSELQHFYNSTNSVDFAENEMNQLWYCRLIRDMDIYGILFYFLMTQCQAAELVHTLGDAHIYSNHVEPLKIQVYGRFID